MSLSIIGAGYGRTGTTSLKMALEQLGFAPCYKWVDAVRAPSPWMDAFENSQVNWESVFGPCQSTVDFPACLFYRDLITTFPLAKVILTVRDCNAWFESTQETFLSVRDLAHLRRINCPLSERMQLVAFGDQLHDRVSVIARYKQHNLEVRRAVPPDRLLVYEIHQGWDPLCKFLGVPVPQDPFPKLNSKEEWKALWA